ncbi:PLP-dependent aminotransferase family protein [Dyella solisilvae]|uniref:PLP-dependent aminotransferase family protein n=1 Tax=Dyella solisilvae TaxID=1920168 RepID=A0A370K2Z1_9GAMM|nr:PLP-dependent aminotransferase family protein [Dyella solisilvae]RDI97012.1 PLP-dependent aminotransferase family protein [Dyella solisilvae]
MEPLLAFPLDIPPRGRLHALHGQLRCAILDGRLRAGQPLPSTRSLAESLGLSRNTVVSAYDRLLSEGYLAARHGAGYRVAAVVPSRHASPHATGGDPRLHPRWRDVAMPRPMSELPPMRHDLRACVPDASYFPYEVWRRLSARALRALSREPALYDSAVGRRALREAIAGHVSFARAVSCSAEDIVVTNGAQHAFDLLARILVAPGETVLAMEDPGYGPVRRLFELAGASVAPVPVDDEGLVVERIPANARVIYVTPSHQSPLGMVISPARRHALLAFARRHGAVVIEDDYDSEFRYGGRPLDALQTLDRDGVVFYVGTFSKSLFPALRLGYVVSPPWALAALARARQLNDWHGDVLAQDTLAPFIAEGHLARHVRKMRRIYGERRQALLDALARHVGDALEPIPAEAGLHVAARLRWPVAAGTVVAEAARQGLRIESLDDNAIGDSAPHGLLFGLGVLPAESMDEAVRVLGRVLEAHRPT